MPVRPDQLLHEIRRLAVPPAADPDSDAALLRRFIHQRDERAFAALVARHGPLVLEVCRRVLRERQAAEDAFQATFLVLARRAASIRPPDRLAAWLHGTARHLALQSLRAAQRRRRREGQAAQSAVTCADPLDALTARELLLALDEEVQRLPASYRLPVLLCCLEGKSQEEAAQQLDWTPGSVKGRLERGRKRLHERLVRRGLTLGAALAAAEAARSTLLADMAARTVQGALAFASGTAPTGAAVLLARGALRGAGMVKVLVVLTLALGAGALGAVAFTLPPPGDEAKPTLREPEPPRKMQPLARVDSDGDPLPPGVLLRLGTARYRGEIFHISLAYSADGRFLVSGNRGEACVWDAATGRLVRRLGADQAQTSGPTALSPDGTLAAVSGWGEKMGGAVYEIATGRLRYRFGRGGWDNMGVFSPDGKLLAWPDGAPMLHICDARTGELVRTLRWLSPPGRQELIMVTAAAFTRDGRQLFSSLTDGTIRCWDLTTGAETRRWRAGSAGCGYTPTQEFSQFRLSSDDSMLAAAVMDVEGPNKDDTNETRNPTGVIQLFDPATGKEVRRFCLPAGRKLPEDMMRGPRFVAFSPDGKELWAGGPDESPELDPLDASPGLGHGVVLAWDVATGKELLRLNRLRTIPWALAFHPDGKTIALGAGHAVRIVDRASGRELLPVDGHRFAITALAVSGDFRRIATAGPDSAILLWDMEAGHELRRLDGHQDEILQVRLSADGRRVFSTSRDQTLRAWDAETGKELYRCVADKDVRSEMALSADGHVLAWTGRAGAILVLDAATGKERRRLERAGDNHSLSFAPTDDRILLRRTAKELHLWDVVTGQHRSRPCDEVPFSIFATAYAPDGRLAAFGGQSDVLVLVDLDTGKVVRRIANVSGEGADMVRCLAFSPDGRTLAWAGPRDRAVRLTEVATGQERIRLTGHYGQVESLAFAADGTRLVTGSSDTTALVWDLAGWPADDKEAPSPSTCWDDLQSNDSAKAYRAIRFLSADPARTVRLLRQRLRPITAVDEQHVMRLVAALDSDQFAIRDKAQTQLLDLGEPALPALRKALATPRTLESSTRLTRLVARLEALDNEKLRGLRAAEVLEHIGSTEAMRLLEMLAGGSPDARLTREAQASLARLTKRANPAR